MTHDQILYWQYKESVRSNKARENLTAEQNVETKRSNIARETETKRHNIATEILSSRQIAEAQRHNMATEIATINSLNEQSRHNRAIEAVQRAQVSVAQSQIGLGYAQLAETARHNISNETYNMHSLAEVTRHNMANETMSQYNIVQTLQETNRANLVSEAIRWDSNRISRMNIQQSAHALAETTRHNRATEVNTLRGQTIDLFTSLYSSTTRLLGSLANTASRTSSWR